MSESSLPATWTWTTLGALLTGIEAGKSFKCDERPPNPGEIGVLKVSAVSWGEFDQQESKTCLDSERVDSQLFVRDGDFLFSRANTIELVGACVIARHVTGQVMLSDKTLRFTFEGVDPQWILYALRSDFGRQEIQRLATGNQESMRNIGQERIRQIRIPLAPKAEQARIIEEAEKQLTRMDAGTNTLHHSQAKLKRYRASVLKAACEGRLVPTEAELARKKGRDYEPARDLVARSLEERRAEWEAKQLATMKEAGKTPRDDKWKAKYSAPAVPLAQELPNPPEGWTWATIKQLASNEPNAITDGPFGSNLKTSHYTPSGPRVVRLQNIGDGRFVDERAHISESHYEALSKHRVFEGDLVLAALGETLPRACQIPASLGPAIVKADCVRFKPDPKLALPRFLLFALNAEPTRKRTTSRIHGVGRPRLNLDEVRSIPLPLPPLAEQYRIVQEVDRRLSVVDELLTAVETNLRRAKRLRQSVLKRAFEGRLVPQDPQDEPATLLLERIKRSRASPAPEIAPVKVTTRRKNTS